MKNRVYLACLAALISLNSYGQTLPAPKCMAPIETRAEWVKSSGTFAAVSFVVRLHKKTQTGSDTYLAKLNQQDFSGVNEEKCVSQSTQKLPMDAQCLVSDEILRAYLIETCGR